MTTKTAWKRDLAIERGISVKQIDQTLRRAHGVVIESSLTHVRSMLDESLRLYLDGNTVAAMWAGQAAWEAAASLSYAVNDLPMHKAKWASVAGGMKGAAIRKQETSGSELRPRIVDAIRRYKGDKRKMASTLARKFGCSPQYIGRIGKETALP